jgi:electron transfer flavoprotein alpha subunit
MRLAENGRLCREGIELEMNPYCRRAVAKAVDLATTSGGEAVVLTMGPPPAEDCLREAIACGADRGILLTDPVLAGSDTLATAQALARLVGRFGPFDAIFAGKNSVDADTGQVGPELAELLGWGFAGPVRELDIDTATGAFVARCETDAGYRDVRGTLPAVLTTAERLCAPAKADPERRAAVEADRIETVGAGVLGDGPWGEAGSPTRVGRIRSVALGRNPVVLDGDPTAQVQAACELLGSRGALDTGRADGEGAAAEDHGSVHVTAGTGISVWGVVEADQPRMAAEIAGEAVRIARLAGGQASVVTLGAHPLSLPGGLAGVVALDAPERAADADYAAALTELVASVRPWAVLLPSTARGREVASRVAAALSVGLTGDAVELEVEADRLVAWKPAFGGQLVAAITSVSDVQMVTLRPGVLPVPATGADGYTPQIRAVSPSGRVEVCGEEVLDNPELLAVAPAVIGVGTGVDPSEYGALEDLRRLLGAELAGTRKVTDRGWMPRSRQIGITGRSVSPRLFVSIGASGKFNHAVGMRAAGTVLAVNADVSAPIFGFCDVGIVADWHEVVPLLVEEISRRQVLP